MTVSLNTRTVSTMNGKSGRINLISRHDERGTIRLTTDPNTRLAPDHMRALATWLHAEATRMNEEAERQRIETEQRAEAETERRRTEAARRARADVIRNLEGRPGTSWRF